MTDSAAVASLRALLDCPVIGPGEAGYDRARSLWNADIDRRPLAAVQPSTAAEVSTAVRWAAAKTFSSSLRTMARAGRCIMTEARRPVPTLVGQQVK